MFHQTVCFGKKDWLSCFALAKLEVCCSFVCVVCVSVQDRKSCGQSACLMSTMQ